MARELVVMRFTLTRNILASRGGGTLTDRMQAARIATGGKDAHVVPRVYGRVGYELRRAGGAIDDVQVEDV
jgi:hypothetical protein